MQNSWGWRGCITTNVALSVFFFLVQMNLQKGSVYRPFVCFVMAGHARLFNSLQTTDEADNEKIARVLV